MTPWTWISVAKSSSGFTEMHLNEPDETTASQPFTAERLTFERTNQIKRSYLDRK